MLVIPLLALGAYNNRYAVPRLKAGMASVLERRRFLRVAGVELGIMVVIVGITAVLVNSEPARTMAMEMGGRAHRNGGQRDDSFRRAVRGSVILGEMEAMVTVDPAAPGENTIDHVHGRRRAAVGSQRLGVAPKSENRTARLHAQSPTRRSRGRWRDRGRFALDRRGLGAPHRGSDGRVRPPDRNHHRARPRDRQVLRRLLFCIALIAMAVPAAAVAHVTLQPGEWEPGAFATVVVRVPNERDDAETTTVTVQFPVNIPSARFQAHPFCEREVEREGSLSPSRRSRSGS